MDPPSLSMGLYIVKLCKNRFPKPSLTFIYTLYLMRTSGYPRTFFSPIRSRFKPVSFKRATGKVTQHPVHQVTDRENPMQNINPQDLTSVLQYANTLEDPKKKKEVLKLGLSIQTSQWAQDILRKM